MCLHLVFYAAVQRIKGFVSSISPGIDSIVDFNSCSFWLWLNVTGLGGAAGKASSILWSLALSDLVFAQLGVKGWTDNTFHFPMGQNCSTRKFWDKSPNMIIWAAPRPGGADVKEITLSTQRRLWKWSSDRVQILFLFLRMLRQLSDVLGV